jgi:hypothetical protein
MELIAQTVTRFGLIVVIVCVIGCLIFLVSGVFAVRDMNQVAFRLERTAIINRAVNAFLRAALCLLAGGVTYYVMGVLDRPATGSAANIGQVRFSASPTPQTIVLTRVPTADLKQAVTVAAVVAQATPNTDPLALPTPSLSDALLVTVTATPFVAPTLLPTLAVIDAQAATPTQLPLSIPTNTPPVPAPASVAVLPTLAIIPVATPIPNANPAAPGPVPTLAATLTVAPAPPAAAIDAGNCATADARLYRPTANETVAGTIDIVGDAVFGSGKYKLEVVPTGENAWRFLWEGFQKIQGEALMPPRFQTSIFPNGTYLMRLTLVTPAGDETARCIVPFNISN